MTRFLIASLALVTTIAATGCVNDCQQCKGGRNKLLGNHGSNECRQGLCNRNGGGNGGGGGGGGGGGAVGPGGAAVAYPYYTVRAPRDFLSANPRGIGP